MAEVGWIDIGLRILLIVSVKLTPDGTGLVVIVDTVIVLDEAEQPIVVLMDPPIEAETVAIQAPLAIDKVLGKINWKNAPTPNGFLLTIVKTYEVVADTTLLDGVHPTLVKVLGKTLKLTLPLAYDEPDLNNCTNNCLVPLLTNEAKASPKVRVTLPPATAVSDTALVGRLIPPPVILLIPINVPNPLKVPSPPLPVYTSISPVVEE